MSYLKEHDEHGGFSASVFYMENWLGSIQVEECDACAYWTVMCEHKLNTWNSNGTQLTCNLCGADGT